MGRAALGLRMGLARRGRFLLLLVTRLGAEGLRSHGGGALYGARTCGGRRNREEAGGVGEVETGLSAAEGEGGDVVCPGGHLRGREGAEPYTGLLIGLADLANPSPRAAETNAFLFGKKTVCAGTYCLERK
ncbi:hypothetical protein M5K25_022424 [Dendrobium thyrsiflorum]|uniref:Uncharacterized protein n=1 Tax=Dendrobium thyrsiflorum TaxID=117978 RepID=A0ABD0U693_DENTH